MNKRLVYIILFALLYISVALVSTIHAISFFGLANTPSLGVMLAITFEIGQAAVLFSILTSSKERSRIMPWCLMAILTLVQVMGNVFSSYKYLITNSASELKYFKEPIFIWTDLPDDMCNVILTYIIGAILPIVALCMTSMLTNYLDDTKKETDNKKKDDEELIIEDEDKKIPNNGQTVIPVDEDPDTTEIIPAPVETAPIQNEEKDESHFINL